jgi:hypothetical protein
MRLSQASDVLTYDEIGIHITPFGINVRLPKLFQEESASIPATPYVSTTPHDNCSAGKQFSRFKVAEVWNA